MRVVFHDKFHDVYTSDPAAARGRLLPAERRLREKYEFVRARSASEADILMVHGRDHVEEVKRYAGVFDMALLAAGGSLQAARLAVSGQPAFALVRPPGHHASPDSCWGFCYFNNLAVAVATLIREGLVASALALDFDLHFGDGTRNIFSEWKEVQYLHPEGSSAGQWMDACRRELEAARPADLLALSCGFDRHLEDWGGLLRTEDYRQIGVMTRQWALSHAAGRRFGVLEGGYQHASLAEALSALLEGLE